MDLETKRLSLFMDLTKKMNSASDQEYLLNDIVETCKEFLQVEASSILFLDQSRQHLYFSHISNNNKQEIKRIIVPMKSSIAGTVATTGIPIICNDSNDSRIYRGVDNKSSMKTRNLVCVPLRVKSKLIGVLEAINAKKSKGFDSDDLELISLFSDYAAITIDNREMLDTLNSRVNQLSGIYRLSQIVAISPSIERLAEETVDCVEQSLKAERISLILWDEKTEEYMFLKGKNFPQEILKSGGKISSIGSVLEEAKRTKEGILYNGDAQVNSSLRFEKKGTYQAESFICVPLIFDNSIMGFLSIADCRDRRWYTKHDFEFAKIMARGFIDGFQHIKVQRQLEEKKIIDHEMEIAAKLQREFFPNFFPSFPGMGFSGVAIPHRQVGGDFYDVIQVAPDAFTGLIADISGKGISSNVFMAICRSILHISIRETPTTSAAAAHANRYIFQNSASGMFVTVFLFHVNTTERRLTYTNAGHFSQLHYCAASKKVKILKGEGKPLGVLEDSKYDEGFLSYQKGDKLVLFTDGVIEAVSAKGEEFGSDRLIRVVEDHPDAPAEELKETIIREVKQFSKTDTWEDDFTLLVMKL